MITIVTGNINDNKTTKMIELFKSSKKGDGFVSLKTMIEHKVHSYDAMKLQTGEKKQLAMHRDFFQNEFEVGAMIGPYLFNQKTIKWIEKELDIMIENRVEPLYFDEIGMLELGGSGFHFIFKKMIESNLDLMVVIRRDLIDKIIQVYHLKNIEIIT